MHAYAGEYIILKMEFAQTAQKMMQKKIPDVSLSFLKENKACESFNITHIHH